MKELEGLGGELGETGEMIGDSNMEWGLRRDWRVRMDWGCSEGNGGVRNLWVRIELGIGGV